MGPTAVLAILTTTQMFLDNALVKRLLQNIANKTTNKIDDWVIDILYTASSIGAPVAEVQSKLDDTQKKYDGMSEEEKKALKTSPSEVATRVASGNFFDGSEG